MKKCTSSIKGVETDHAQKRNDGEIKMTPRNADGCRCDGVRGTSLHHNRQQEGRVIPCILCKVHKLQGSGRRDCKSLRLSSRKDYHLYYSTCCGQLPNPPHLTMIKGFQSNFSRIYSNRRLKWKMRTILSLTSRRRTFPILSITLWEVEKEIETFSFEFKRNRQPKQCGPAIPLPCLGVSERYRK